VRKISRVVLFLAIGLVMAVILGPLGPVSRRGEVSAPLSPGKDGNMFALVPPVFAQEARLGFPEIEAGISAYLHIDRNVDLSEAEKLFRGVEAKGEGYVIGIVELEGFPEEMWPHLYVNSDGWFLAYYSKYDPASKLFPWYTYQGGPIISTTLRDALAYFTTALFSKPRAPFHFSEAEGNLRYYDFRFPEATHFVLAVDEITSEGWDSLRYAIPLEVKVFEGSWLHYVIPPVSSSCSASCWSEISIDDVKLHTTWYERGGNSQFVWGNLQKSFLTVDQPHVARVGQGRKKGYCFTAGRSGIVVAFVYR